jgi:hypothetical protein
MKLSKVQGATPRYDSDGRVILDIATCGTCGRSWNDAAVSASTPVPSGRCPSVPAIETHASDATQVVSAPTAAQSAPNLTPRRPHTMPPPLIKQRDSATTSAEFAAQLKGRPEQIRRWPPPNWTLTSRVDAGALP